MIVCPVCEHAQPRGAECEVCGKRLAGAGEALPDVAPVDGLEPTRHPAVGAPAEPVPGLEPTRHGDAALAPAEPVPDLEAGRAAPVDAPEDRVPDLEHASGAAPADAPTAVPAVVTCRYCRTPAAPGERVCGRCGMRLPVFTTPAPEGPAAGETPVRRCSCGAAVTHGRCAACGARVS